MLHLGHEKIMSTLAWDTDRTIQMLIETRDILQSELASQASRMILSNSELQTESQTAMLRALGNAQDIEILILQSLRFPAIDHRHIEIPEAHCKTFRWILDESFDQPYEWSNFVQWLKSGKGLYWISGKAGSGKSTLMRFIFDHKDTRSHLQDWAQGFDLEIAGFFFWNSGTLEQRSQSGLLRSLLYQVLCRRPDLVREVFPDEWSQQSSIMANHGQCSSVTWSLHALKSAFKRWVALAPISTMLCFFIDGLDEYEGDHEEMCNFFTEISASARFPIKLCVSSRPWVVFDVTLKGVPGLKLQDLTYSDIQAYVRDTLECHPRMALLTKAEPQHAVNLVNEIVAKASGVFLWVSLVVKSLLNGLMNRDGIDILQQRLRALPPDLDALFAYMLRHIDPIYKEQACRLFQVHRILSSHQFFLARQTNSSWHDESFVNPLELQLAAEATLSRVKSERYKMMDPESLPESYEILDVHLKTRCQGLLELHHLGTTYEAIELWELGEPATATVSYLHRTVGDFLATETAQCFFSSNVGPEFDPMLSILLSFVIRVKRAVCISCDGRVQTLCNENMWSSIVEALRMVRLIPDEYSTLCFEGLNQLCEATFQEWDFTYGTLESCQALPLRATKQQPKSDDDHRHMWNRSFLGEAVTQGCQHYVERTIAQDPSILADESKIPLLLYSFRLGNTIEPEMIILLLKLGANPNHLWFGSSPWQHALTLMHSTATDEEAENQRYIVLKTMLEYGASPYTTCTHNHLLWQGNEQIGTALSHTVYDVIIDAFQTQLPEQTSELLAVYSDQRDKARKVRSSKIAKSNGLTTSTERSVASDHLGKRTRRKR